MKKLLLALFIISALALPAYADTNVFGIDFGVKQADCSAVTTNGQPCWDNDNFILYVGNGTTAGAITELSSDTTPQLGGNLDLNTHEITVKDTVFIPIGWCIDGTTAPSASATLTSTNKVTIREFSGVANNDVMCNWIVPDDFTGSTIEVKVLGWVSNATAPANTEVVAFSISGASVANSDLLSAAMGAAQTSSLTADATYAQYDRLATAYSSAISVTGIAAGESAILTLTRLATSTDTYAQLFGVTGIVIKYSKAMTND